MDVTALRSMAEGFMTDECAIFGSTSVEFDPDTFTDVLTAGTALYEGKCRVRPVAADQVAVGEALVRRRTHDLWLPWETVGVMVGHVVELTTSDDPYLIDRTFTVVDIEGGTNGAHRKLGLVEILDVDEGEAT